MVFPAEMLVDYVRVYQRDGETNVGCDPPDYPTSDYINNHFEAYDSEFSTYVFCFPGNESFFSDPNITTWQWDKPKNSLVCRVSVFARSNHLMRLQYEGGC